MIEREKVVATPDDVFEAIKLLKQGKNVLCSPNLVQFLEYQTRVNGIDVKIQGNVFVYEFIPIKKGGEKHGENKNN
ncbi:MAG: hypothetical protein DRP29_07115 [Thermodesulfobacteriota bacterium]|nr:MAG: hypothetical protein DRP29_07115 [Thermodesulfobacteriota bacterium]